MDSQNLNNAPVNPQPYGQPYGQQPAYAPADTEMSIGGWIGTLLITLIPLVGFIMLIVWAASSDPTRVARKRWAIAQLIIMVILFVLSLVFSSAIVAAFGSMM